MCFCAKFWHCESTNVESYEPLKSEVDDRNIDLVLTLSVRPDPKLIVGKWDAACDMELSLQHPVGLSAALWDILDGINRKQFVVTPEGMAGAVPGES